MRKIIIIGEAGRGKTTLAEKLSAKLSIPHHSTDDYFYEVKFTRPRDRQEALKQISKLYEEPEWIVEGTTMWLLEPGIKHADKIIYLRHKSLISQWLILLRRYFQRKEDTLKETLMLMRHVFYKRYGLGYKKGKTNHAQFVEPYKDKVTTLSSFKEINEFVDSLPED